jgi:CubicO group peptidase (beta-lactamase class C family)
MKSKLVRIISILIIIVIFIFAAAPPAATQSVAPEQAAAPPAGQMDAQELEAFLDKLLAAEMADNHVPGAIVTVVKDGSPLLTKGYGYADLVENIPVDPERNLFHIASISKLFIWTAVMQLVEQGRLSLDADVNDYLDFTIPATFPEPITVRDLMCHTAGFEDKSLGMWRLEVEAVGPLGDYLSENLPARIFPAGAVISYSNYGASMAGYIVERISGLPFSEYAQQNIFQPLGMTRSSYLQPLPESLSADLVNGYNYFDGQYVAGTPYDQSYPAGSLSTTAGDMARFMIAHLQDGELEGQRILQAETARQMHSQLYAADPRLDGMAYGFFEHVVNGQRILTHGGNYITYMSNLILIPEQNVGFFISTNGSGGSKVIGNTSDAFLDHYYSPLEMPNPESPADFAERIAPYLGSYTNIRGNFTTFERMNSLFFPLNIRLEDDRTLEFATPGQVYRLVEVEPGLLQQIGEPANRVVYYTDADGHRILTGSFGIGEPFSFYRSPWYGISTLHMLLFVSGAVLFLGALVAWPIASIIKRRKHVPDAEPTPPTARLARWSAALFGLLLLISALGATSVFLEILPGYGVPRVWFEIPPLLNLMMALSYVLAGLAMAMVVFAVLAWMRRYWSPAGRIFYSLLGVMAVLLVWALAYWNLFL